MAVELTTKKRSGSSKEAEPRTESEKKTMRKKVRKVLGEHARGKLKSSSGSKVTKRKQAIAIALSEGRRAVASSRKK